MVYESQKVRANRFSFVWPKGQLSKNPDFSLSANPGLVAARESLMFHPLVRYDYESVGTVTCDSVVDYSFLDMESRAVCKHSGTLNALQNVLHVAIDVLPELQQTTAQVIQSGLAVAGAN